ncbi:MAG: hypothetical protein ACKVS8_04915 [Phycisphaerales bacterium]
MTDNAGSPSSLATVLYAAADLIWATKIKGTGDAIGIACRPVRSLDMLEARLADTDVRGLILDLDAAALAFELLARVRASRSTPRDQSIRVVAFGPHVAVDLLQRAQAEGASAVLARGAFGAQLPAILRALTAGTPVASKMDD